MVNRKNIDVFERHRVFSETEIRSRYEIKLESYTKVLNIEAETMLMMTQREILPAVMNYAGKIAAAAAQIRSVLPTASIAAQENLLNKLTAQINLLSDRAEQLKAAIANNDRSMDAYSAAKYEHDVIIPIMNDIRAAADELETVVDRRDWPFPTYADLLFNV